MNRRMAGLPLKATYDVSYRIDRLPEDQTDLPRGLIEDLRDAADSDGEPLDDEALASPDRGLADVQAGRAKSLEEYERERGL
jgi:hypothetical protein